MASTLTASSHLPAKKRKASNASSSLEAASIPPTTHVTAGGNAATATLEKKKETAPVNNNYNNDSYNYTSSITREIDNSRLPSKKRKGSQDTSATLASVTSSAKQRNNHNESAEELLTNDLSKRKESHDSNSLLPSINSSLHKWSEADASFTATSLKIAVDDLLVGAPSLEEPATTATAADDASKTPTTVFADSKPAAVPLQQPPPPVVLSNTAAAASCALDHLEALGSAPPPVAAAASSKRKESVDDNNSQDTLASSGQRMLLEAIMMSSQAGESREGSDQQQPKHQMLQQHQNHHQHTVASSASAANNNNTTSTTLPLSTLDHYNSYAAAAAASQSSAAARFGRDRLESWGGMSDLSNMLNHHGGILHEDEKSAAVPSRISLHARDRFNSIASLGDVSFPLDGDLSGAHLQAYVAAAVASVGDQLAELAGAVEHVANSTDSITYDALKHDPVLLAHHQHDGSNVDLLLSLHASDDNSISAASNLIIGATADGKQRKGRSRTWSTGSGKISVDLDAVQAAVDAAQAATGGFDLDSISGDAGLRRNERTKSGSKRPSLRRLPLQKRPRTESGDSSTSSLLYGNDDTPTIRNNGTRKVNFKSKSYGKPLPHGANKMSAQPLKKRAKRNSSPIPDRIKSAHHRLDATPRISNKRKHSNNNYSDNDDDDDELLDPMDVPSSDFTNAKPSAKGSSNHKWDSMFDVLVKFIDERKQEETEGQSQDEKDKWSWDGNVPTCFKTKDGKALGRWVNNQRSAKSKGTLKEDREDQLIKAGLKWSVVTSNAWNEMFQELRAYIQDQVKEGKKWDGNVPT
jgi:hypothetical protein